MFSGTVAFKGYSLPEATKVCKNGVAVDTDQSVALHYVLTIDTNQVLSKTHNV